jgi:hypothetical protein
MCTVTNPPRNQIRSCSVAVLSLEDVIVFEAHDRGHQPQPERRKDATGVVVTDNLPSGVDFVSATSGLCERTGDTVTAIWAR